MQKIYIKAFIRFLKENNVFNTFKINLNQNSFYYDYVMYLNTKRAVLFLIDAFDWSLSPEIDWSKLDDKWQYYRYCIQKKSINNKS